MKYGLQIYNIKYGILNIKYIIYINKLFFIKYIFWILPYHTYIPYK